MSSLFYEDFKIDKPLRLIELFAGYGSQAMAFKRIGVPFEHWYVCEWDKFACKSYTAVHGFEVQPSDIKNIHAEDLNIVDTDKYCYFMTYSFPCTDLSVAGQMAGMKKGSGTRSGLLWEVERLLNECKELPQVLFMENVPQVISEQNMPDFEAWLRYLENKGYSSYYKVLNARDFGVPQNRERCFMFSFLGDWDYIFPDPQPLRKTVVDILEDKVDERYYITNEKAKKLILDLFDKNILPMTDRQTDRQTDNVSTLELICQLRLQELSMLPTQSVQGMTAEFLTTKAKKPVCLNGTNCVNLYRKDGTEQAFQDRIYRSDKESVAVTTSFRPYYLVKE